MVHPIYQKSLGKLYNTIKNGYLSNTTKTLLHKKQKYKKNVKKRHR